MQWQTLIPIAGQTRGDFAGTPVRQHLGPARTDGPVPDDVIQRRHAREHRKDQRRELREKHSHVHDIGLELGEHSTKPQAPPTGWPSGETCATSRSCRGTRSRQIPRSDRCPPSWRRFEHRCRARAALRASRACRARRRTSALHSRSPGESSRRPHLPSHESDDSLQRRSEPSRILANETRRTEDRAGPVLAAPRAQLA